MAAGSRRCACGAVATGKRVGGQWVRQNECRRCLAATRISHVVNGLARAKTRDMERELELLRKLEDWVRHRVLFIPNDCEKLLSDLDTLRQLQSTGE